MWCRTVRNQLSAYADGELALTERESVEAHLAVCQDCARERMSLERVVRLTELIPAEEPSAALHHRIMASLASAEGWGAAAPAPGRRTAALGAWAGFALAGCAAAVAAGVMTTRAPQLAAPSPAPGEAPREARGPAAPAPAARQTASAAQLEIVGPVPRRPAARMAAASPQITVSRSPRTADSRTAIRERPARASFTARGPRPLPADLPESSGVVSTELRAVEPSDAASMDPKVAAMPGDPVVNTAGGVMPLLAPEANVAAGGSEPETAMRVAGMAGEGEATAESGDGLQELRQYLEERSRTVPQPPMLKANQRERRQRKSL